jgi:hypothetical protein
MTIGIELGWQAVFVVTVNDDEALAVTDAGDPAIVQTLPVVAQSASGALVGRPAVDITGDDSWGELRIEHAFVSRAPKAGAPEFPSALSVLLEKLARDLRAFGYTTNDSTFIVSDEIVPRKVDSKAREWGQSLPEQQTPELLELAAAAASAGFSKFNIAYRAEAAAILGWSLLRPVPVGNHVGNVHTIVVDISVRAVRVTVVELKLDRGKVESVFPHLSTASTGADSWLGEIPVDRTLEFELFGHFARVVCDQLTGSLSPAALDRLWTQVQEASTPDRVAVIDTQNQRRIFDVAACRKQLLTDVDRTVTSLLTQLDRLDPVRFVFVTGHLARIPGMQGAVEDAFNNPTTHTFKLLPLHALASIVRSGSLPRLQLGPETAATEPALRRLPINDGKRGPDVDEDRIEPWSDPHAESGPFDDVLGRGPALERLQDRAKDDIGEEIGSYWAAKTDSLLRLRATAPIVPLKKIYFTQLAENGIAELVAGDGQGDPELDRDVRVPITDRAIDGIVKALSNVVTNNDARENLITGIRKGYNAAAEVGAETRYVADLRSRIVPNGTELVLVRTRADGESAALPGVGIAVPGRAMLAKDISGVEATAEDRAVRLGYSSDGFRPLLATAVLHAKPKNSGDVLRSFFGGLYDRKEASILAVILIAAVAVASIVSWTFLYPTDITPQAVVAGASGQFGRLSCQMAPGGDGNILTTCDVVQGDGPALATNVLPQGCYVGMLRLVGPAFLSGEPHPRLPTPLDLQCVNKGFKPESAFNLSEMAAQDGTATRIEYGKVVADNVLAAHRVTTITQDSASDRVRVADIVWIGYNDGKVAVSLAGLWQLIFPGVNHKDELASGSLCLDLGLSMHALTLDEGIASPVSVHKVVDSPLGPPVSFTTLLLSLPSPLPSVLEMKELTSFVTKADGTPYTDVNAPPPPEAPSKIPPIPKGLVLNGDATSRTRLIGSCPPQ